MSIDENGILNTYLNLSEFNKQLLSVSIAEAMKPLVYHLKCTELNCLYDYYLIMLWDLKPLEKSLIREYETKTDVIFNYQEFDESSFSYYTDPNFTLYLAYEGKEALRNCFEWDNEIYRRIILSSFFNINRTLDDYYYHMYTKNSISHKLESILEQVSKRKFEYSGISMLNGIIELCNDSNGSKEMVQNYIDLYTINFGSVLNFNIDSDVIS